MNFTKIGDIVDIELLNITQDIPLELYESLYSYHKFKKNIPDNILNGSYESIMNWIVGFSYIELQRDNND